MNEIFKLSKMVQNDLKSLCIVTKSVPAKFGVPGKLFLQLNISEITGDIVVVSTTQYLRDSGRYCGCFYNSVSQR